MAANAPRIDTREELVNALTEAAELEHGLMLQYLYAGMSLKQDESEGITADQLAMIHGWREAIHGVAMQEMGHLATACNLLAVIGGGAHLRRPEFPQPARYFHPSVAFSLEPLSLATIRRFIHFEQPEGFTDFERFGLVALDPVEYPTVGNLYRQIAEAIACFDEGRLFVDPDAACDSSDWTFRVHAPPVFDRESAIAAIYSVIEEGEGTPAAGEASHFQTFLRIRDQLQAELGRCATFAPARPVVPNPKTRPALIAGATHLTEPRAVSVAELFNAVYATVLLVLLQFFARNDPAAIQREALKSASKKLMRRAVAPLGNLLTALPAHPRSRENAGPGFEVYSDLRIPSNRRATWLVILERLEEEARGCDDLVATYGPPLDVLTEVGEDLREVATQLHRLL